MSKNRANNRDRVWNRYEPDTSKKLDWKRYRVDCRGTVRNNELSEIQARIMIDQNQESYQ